jgi:hypothetical protein
VKLPKSKTATARTDAPETDRDDGPAPMPGEIHRVKTSENGGVAFIDSDQLRTAEDLHFMMHAVLDDKGPALARRALDAIEANPGAKKGYKRIRKSIASGNEDFIDGFKEAINLMAAYYVVKTQTTAKSADPSVMKPEDFPPAHYASVLNSVFMSGLDAMGDFVGIVHMAEKAGASPQFVKMGYDMANHVAHVELMPIAERYEESLGAAKGATVH